MKPNRCTPMFNSQQCRCSVDWEREDGPETCRFFIHDVTMWSKCGHLVDGYCLSGRAQSEAMHEIVAVGRAEDLERLTSKWAGSSRS